MNFRKNLPGISGPKRRIRLFPRESNRTRRNTELWVYGARLLYDDTALAAVPR